MKPLLVNICGNVASGKSTVVAALKDRLSLPVIVEDTSRISLFPNYCEDPQKWAAPAQMQFLVYKLDQLLGALSSRVTVLDRSLHEDVLIFATLHKALGNISQSDFESLSLIYQASLQILNFREVNILVYCSSFEQSRRIANRSAAERKMLDAEYLRKLGEMYEEHTTVKRMNFCFDSERDDIRDLFQYVQESIPSPE